MHTSNYTKKLNAWITPQLMDKLRAESEKRQMGISEYVRMVLMTYFEERGGFHD